MRRREFITLLGGAGAAWPLTARAQQPERVRRVGVLIAGPSENDPESQLRLTAFRSGLVNLGRIEGQNLQMHVRWPGDNAEQLRVSAAEIVQTSPDVVFAGNTAALLALRAVGSRLPTVFAQVTDPVGAGLVESIARPGGNTTGFALYEYDVAPKWAEMLREIAPQTACIGVIYDAANNAERHLPMLKKTLPPEVKLLPLLAKTRYELEGAIKQIANEPQAALIVLPGPLAVANHDVIIKLAIQHRLPLFYPYHYFTLAGGLISYGADLRDQYRSAASYVDRILRGEKPADLPVQFPTKYTLVINLKTAKALGLNVPPMFIARADEVIE